MEKDKTEYSVEVKISGRAWVLTKATSESEAIDNVSKGDFYGCDITEWSTEEALSAEENI